jgi:hypothetical protein
MPRDGSNIYGLPHPAVVAGTTISSGVHNNTMNDIAQDLNTARPIVAGGTGAINADTALFNLKAEKAAQLVTNYDAHLWVPGSFYSATTATGEPVDGRAFSGVAYIGEALANPPTNLNVTLEARDVTDGKLYIRRKTAGTWGSWMLDGDVSGVNGDVAARVLKAGDTMTGMLVLPATTPTLGTHATNKTYVDAADTALAAVNTTQDTAIGNRVRYDASQSLTAPQQAQARSNINAAPSSTTVTRQSFLTGSGTYTTPASCVRIEIEMVGGGGGGAGSGTTPGAAGSAAATTFGSMTASAGGSASTFTAGTGSTATGGYLNLPGNNGQNGSGATNTAGGFGGVGPLGGQGKGGTAGGGAGTIGQANTGAGGGGGSVSSTINGGGGGASGAYLRGTINSPAASYSYAVGAGGTGGTAGTGGAAGAAGGSGIIIVTEFYA